jgi:hypothetical protein
MWWGDAVAEFEVLSGNLHELAEENHDNLWIGGAPDWQTPLKYKFKVLALE